MISFFKKEGLLPYFILIIFFHLLTPFFSVGYFHPDEHFQILEFINFKMGHIKASDLPWEFPSAMRSWFVPFVFYYILLPFKFLSPFGWEILLRLLCSLLGLWAFLKLFFTFKTSENQKFFFIISATLWFIPFIHARISSEAICASLFTLGFCYGFGEKKNNLLMGLFLGLSFLARFQIGISIAALLLWILINKGFKNTLLPLFTILLVLALGLFIDYWGYGELKFTSWNYLYQNLVLKKAQGFGTSPWYDYFLQLNKKALLPFGLLISFSFLLFWKKNLNHPLSWATFSFFLIHSLIGHKELRFLFPLVNFLPLIFTTHFYSYFKKWPFKVFLYSNILLLFVASFRPVHPSVAFYKYFSKISNPPSKLHYLGEINPFALAQLKTRFYINHPPQMIPLSDDAPLKGWVFGSHGKYLEKLKDCQKKYVNYPEFLLNIKAFNWPRRSKVWFLYLCQ